MVDDQARPDRNAVFGTPAGTSEEAAAATIDGNVLLQWLPAARRFAAFDLQTGRVRWSIRTKAAVNMSAVATGARIYFGDTSGAFYRIAESDGDVVAARVRQTVYLQFARRDRKHALRGKLVIRFCDGAAYAVSSSLLTTTCA